ncbi:MAG TPA: DUF6491 family protein [Sphingomicrobium sp.]|jgi:hypothetical protein|nr:DUF6491 family protein [Sphingomicrobium sp.]
MNRTLALFALAASATACTANQAPHGQAVAGSGRCFNAATINDFHAVDRHTVIVTAGVNHNYLLDILATCPEIDWTLRIGLRSTSGSSWVCQGQDAELLVPAPTGIDRCPVLGVRPLSIEEAKALRAKSY